MIKTDYSFRLQLEDIMLLYSDEIISDNVLKSFSVSNISPIFRFNKSTAFMNKLGNRNFKNYYPIMNSALTSLKFSYTS